MQYRANVGAEVSTGAWSLQGHLPQTEQGVQKEGPKVEHVSSLGGLYSGAEGSRV